MGQGGLPQKQDKLCMLRLGKNCDIYSQVYLIRGCFRSCFCLFRAPQACEEQMAIGTEASNTIKVKLR